MAKKSRSVRSLNGCTRASNVTFPLYSRVNRSRRIHWLFCPLPAVIQEPSFIYLNNFHSTLIATNNKVPSDIEGNWATQSSSWIFSPVSLSRTIGFMKESPNISPPRYSGNSGITTSSGSVGSTSGAGLTSTLAFAVSETPKDLLKTRSTLTKNLERHDNC